MTIVMDAEVGAGRVCGRVLMGGLEQVFKVIYQRNGDWKDMKGLMNALKDEGAFVQYRVV